jgi:hypothetical protein
MRRFAKASKAASSKVFQGFSLAQTARFWSFSGTFGELFAVVFAVNFSNTTL